MSSPLKRHFLLMPVGSAGDVHPFVGMGLELQRRGHRVTLATNAHFQSLCEQVGLSFSPIGTDEQFHDVIQNADLWKPSPRATQLIFKLATHMMREQYAFIASQVQPGCLAVVAGPLALGARLAQEHLKIPLATVQLAPAVFFSSDKPPCLPGLWMPPWFPRWLKRSIWRLADNVIDRMTLEPVNLFAGELGVKPIHRLVGQWWNSPQRVIAMFPSWFGDPAPDWPPQVRLTGFGLFDESANMPTLAPAVQTFLQAGDPPIVFTPGSANVHGRTFFQTAVRACEQLQRRGILLTRHSEQLPAKLPSFVRHFDFVPLSQLLPRCAAMVYHGGIGTLSQVCRAGRPHLIVKLSHDQYDNARRIERLGLGCSLTQRRYTPRRAIGVLSRLLSDSTIQAQCEQIAKNMASDPGIPQACDEAEALFEMPCV